MPLTAGAPVGDSIKELYNHGSHPRPRNQIIAIAEANNHRHAAGGIAAAAAPHRAAGGFSPASPVWEEHQAARELQHDTFHPSGLFGGSGAGRTDRLPRAVPVDSFVMPADVVAGLGSGNNLAGAKIMDGILASGPFGTTLPRGRHAAGGSTGSSGLSHVMVASGEYLVGRDKVADIGRRMRATKKSKARSDLAAGHEALRGLVEKVRHAQRKFLASAPKPKA